MALSAERQDQLIRAEEARRLLETPLLQQAFAGLEQKWLSAWRNSPPVEMHNNPNSGPPFRERLWYLLTALDELRAELQRHIAQGKIIASELQAEQYRDGLEGSNGGSGDTRPTV